MTIVESLLAVIAVVGGAIEWQIIRGNNLANDAKELLQEIKMQQNLSAQELRDKITVFTVDVDRDIERAADINLQLSQNLRETKIRMETVLDDLRETNLKLLARIEVLDRKVENGNGKH